MKNLYYVLAVLLLFNWNANAQFIKDMENCDSNGGFIDLRNPSDSFPCDCIDGTGCFISCSSTQVHSGNWSGFIPGDSTSYSIVKLGDKIFEQWGLEFWLFIPSNKEAFFNIQGESLFCPGFSAVGDFYFNKDLNNEGIGVLENSVLGDIPFNFPQNQWFQLTINVDLSFGIALATWKFEVDCVEVIPEGTSFKNGDNTVPAALGALLFSSISDNNELYIDDINFVSGNMDCILDSNVVELINFSVNPNPTQDILNIETNKQIKLISIYNLQGRIVKKISGLKSIDVSNLSTGLYFVEVSTEKGRSVQKLIKN